MRCFVSLDLPEPLHDPIREIQATLEPAAGLRATDPTQAHVTLQFLGEVATDRSDTIISALERAVAHPNIEPFELRFGGLGVFPTLEYISVVWIGVERGVTAVEALHEAVVDELHPLGFEPDDHGFTPHVTIGRMDHGGGKSHVQSVVTEQSPTVGSMSVTDVRLTESVLTADGPRYRTVESIPLE